MPNSQMLQDELERKYLNFALIFKGEARGGGQMVMELAVPVIPIPDSEENVTATHVAQALKPGRDQIVVAEKVYLHLPGKGYRFVEEIRFNCQDLLFVHAGFTFELTNLTPVGE